MLDDPDRSRKRVEATLKRVVKPAIYGARAPLRIEAHHVHGEPIAVSEARRRDYVPMAVGDAWGGAWDTTWFRMRATVPPGWSGSEVTALIDLGGAGMVGFTAEGLVWDGDQPRQGLHMKHREYVVARRATGGEEIELLIEAAANPIPPWGTDPWPLLMADVDGPPIYRLDRAELAVAHRDVEALYFDLLVLSQLLTELPASGPRAAQVLAALEAACDAIAPDDVEGSVPGRASCSRRRSQPRRVPRRSACSAIGHAHIDSAWLWPIRETKRKCARTFANALHLMDDYPEYRFSASQAQQYAWMKELYPPLYDRIRAQVQAGRFEPIGSMWVEADCNIPSGESLVRQIVHGKRFFLDEFGRETTDLWLPDVFGYSAALPQILHAAGVSSFLTQKMSWSETNRFPHSTFWWEGIDGTRVLTHFPPADTYNGDMSVGELAKAERQFAQRAESKHSVYPYGFGDGGGGPTRAMLESARRVTDLEGAPRVELDTVASFWDKVRVESPDLPVWVGELYLEYHRGTYTTNGPIKRANRRNEQALRAAELWSVAAGAGDWSGYPAAALDEAWKLLLLNQFHDIIPGSSIHWANEDCLPRPRTHREHCRRRDRRRPAHHRRPHAHRRRSGGRRVQLGVACARGAPRSRHRRRRGPGAGLGPGVRLCDDRPRRRHRARGAGGAAGSGHGLRARARERAAPRRVGRLRAPHVGLRQGARPRGARARRARQLVPAPRRQPTRVRRVERRHRLSRPSRRPRRRLVDQRRRARALARRGALRPRVRLVDDHADDAPREPARAGSTSTPRSTGTSCTSS